MDVHISQFFLASIAGALGFCARILYGSLGTLQELNLKLGIIIEQVKDHEQRLRVVETVKKKGS